MHWGISFFRIQTCHGKFVLEYATDNTIVIEIDIKVYTDQGYISVQHCIHII